VTPTKQPTPTPTPSPAYDFYLATLQDCCTGFGYESIKISVPQGTNFGITPVVYGNINNGYGPSCFIVTSSSPTDNATIAMTTYVDCTTCQTQNNVICPEIHRLDPCGSPLGPLAYAIYLPNGISVGSTIIAYTGSPSNQICFEVGGIVAFTPNVFFISEHLGDCSNCLPSPSPTPTKTPTPTPSSTSGVAPG
jgi:hypothetical protein